MLHQLFLWGGFIFFVFVMLALDLGVFHRRAHDIGFREALTWSLAWIALALSFNAGIYLFRGHEAALQFLAGYLLEKSLSVDNLFVFLLIFTYFKVPAKLQHTILFWGILGALVMRGVFIASGIALLERFHWVIYLFGAFLIFTGIKIGFEKDKEIAPEKNPVLRLFKRCFPVTDQYEGSKFFVRKNARVFATPLLVILLVVETTDILFAVDSIPAVLAVTRKPFIVYTSNVFAILGLRALYFVLASLMRLFHHLHYGLAVVLAFVGIKMLLSEIYPISIGASLGVIAITLAASVIASLAWPPKH